MIIETDRVILRPWKEEDAKYLYEYAKDPRVGPAAGWPIHKDENNSLEIIKNVLNEKETYAVVLKEENIPVGSIGLMIGEKSNLSIGNDEGEIGYWIGVPYWGRGLIPESIVALLNHGFEELGLKKIWCGYFEENLKSKRAQEKCGFILDHIRKDTYWPLMDYYKNEYITCITKERWIENKKG